MIKKHKIALVVPAFNEEGKIGAVVKKAKERAPFLDAVIVVNDCSKDNTEAEAKEAGAIVQNHKKNKGAGAAIRTGSVYALKKRYDIVAVMGGDDQDDPKYIAKLSKPIIENGYDFVQGSRYKFRKKKLKIPVFRLLTTNLYSFVFSLAAGKKITDATNGFRAYRTSILKSIDLNKRWLNRYELEPYLMLEAVSRGYKFKEVGVPKYWPEGKSYSKMVPFKSWWSISRPMIYRLLGIRR